MTLATIGSCGAGVNSMKVCTCCDINTTVLCVNGACIGCHNVGLCGHK